jgi:hypothetical protein
MKQKQKGWHVDITVNPLFEVSFGPLDLNTELMTILNGGD